MGQGLEEEVVGERIEEKKTKMKTKKKKMEQTGKKSKSSDKKARPERKLKAPERVQSCNQTVSEVEDKENNGISKVNNSKNRSKKRNQGDIDKEMAMMPPPQTPCLEESCSTPPVRRSKRSKGVKEGPNATTGIEQEKSKRSATVTKKGSTTQAQRHVMEVTPAAIVRSRGPVMPPSTACSGTESPHMITHSTPLVAAESGSDGLQMQSGINHSMDNPLLHLVDTPIPVAAEGDTSFYSRASSVPPSLPSSPLVSNTDMKVDDNGAHDNDGFEGDEEGPSVSRRFDGEDNDRKGISQRRLSQSTPVSPLPARQRNKPNKNNVSISTKTKQKKVAVAAPPVAGKAKRGKKVNANGASINVNMSSMSHLKAAMATSELERQLQHFKEIDDFELEEM
eukprot:Nk52_evm47s485 gene=Nk52_evmTU47s485